MRRYYNNMRRPSTIERDARVLEVYRQIITQLGDIAQYVSRMEIYRRVAAVLHLCPKTIERIVGHVQM